MNRYYLPAGEWQEGELTLTGGEASHCSRVMRASEGDEIVIFDGAGRSAACGIKSISRDLVRGSIFSEATQPPVANPITLCQAIPKGGNMELIVQKAVELGVSEIQPLITAHTVVRPESNGKKQIKWQRIALEACKQCGQNYLPQVREPIHFSHWLENVLGEKESFDSAYVAALDEQAVHLKARLAGSPIFGKIALLIGPEGDFSVEEYQAAYGAGFQPISFGDIVMRVETASIYGLSILRHELTSP